MQRNINVDCMGPMAHHPEVFAGRLAGSSPQLKLVYHAEDDLATTATWFKVGTAASFNTLFSMANVDAATQACQDEAMTQQCRCVQAAMRDGSELPTGHPPSRLTNTQF